MPRIRTVHVSYARKFNLGNYQSAALECATWAELDEGEDPAVAAAELRRFCRKQVREEHALLPKPEEG